MAETPAGETVTSGHASFASTALLTYVSQLAFGTLSLVNVLIVARALGPSGRGQVVFLTTAAYVTAQLALLGVEQANVNLASSEPGLRSALAGNSLVFALLLGATSIGIVSGLMALFPRVAGPATGHLRWLMLGAIPIVMLEFYLLLLVQAGYAFGLANLAYLCGPIVNVTVNGTFAVAGLLSVTTAVCTWIAGQTLGTLLLVWRVARAPGGFGRPDRHLARRSLGFGVKAHAGRVMLLGNYRLDQWILGAIAGARELGLYSVAVAWGEVLFYLPTALALVQRPDLVRFERRSATREAAAVFRAAAILTVPLILGLVIVAPFLCITIFGAPFRGSIEQLRILSAGAFGIVALKLLGNALTAQGKPILETTASALAFVVTIGLDVALIPGHKGIGASLASTLAYSTGGVAAMLLFRRALGARSGDLIPRRGDAAALWRNAMRLLNATPLIRTQAGAAASPGHDTNS